MPRSNVPVQLASAARDLDLHFRQPHKKDGAPIEQRRFCSQDDAEVQWADQPGKLSGSATARR